MKKKIGFSKSIKKYSAGGISEGKPVIKGIADAVKKSSSNINIPRPKGSNSLENSKGSQVKYNTSSMYNDILNKKTFSFEKPMQTIPKQKKGGIVKSKKK